MFFPCLFDGKFFSVSLTNILWAAFSPISSFQKITNTNSKYRKPFQNTFLWSDDPFVEKYWSTDLKECFATFFRLMLFAANLVTHMLLKSRFTPILVKSLRTIPTTKLNAEALKIPSTIVIIRIRKTADQPRVRVSTAQTNQRQVVWNPWANTHDLIRR